MCNKGSFSRSSYNEQSMNQNNKTAKDKVTRASPDTHMTTNKTTKPQHINALYMLHYSPLSPCVLASD